MEMEHRVIEILEGRRKELGMTVKELAALVYPNLKPNVAVMRMQNLRTPMSVNQKRKRLTYTDFVMMSSALKISPAEVITLVSQDFPDIRDPKAEPKPKDKTATLPLHRPVLTETAPAA